MFQVLAKLVCGINKPNKQTVLPHSAVPELFSTTPIQKVRNLGGKLGETLVQTLKCQTMGDLGKLSERELFVAVGSKTGYAISINYNLCSMYQENIDTRTSNLNNYNCYFVFPEPGSII